MSETDGQAPVVLVVEDNPDDTVLLDLAAKEVCPEVEFVFMSDGLAALAYLRGEEGRDPRRPPPRVVVVDARLPNIDGFTMVRRIRQISALRQVKVLLWTDGRESDFEEQARRAGADEAMFKRGSFHELVQAVARICELAKARE
jgi:two-component system, response regulator